jgi:hypothetical protein
MPTSAGIRRQTTGRPHTDRICSLVIGETGPVGPGQGRVLNSCSPVTGEDPPRAWTGSRSDRRNPGSWKEHRDPRVLSSAIGRKYHRCGDLRLGSRDNCRNRRLSLRLLARPAAPARSAAAGVQWPTGSLPCSDRRPTTGSRTPRWPRHCGTPACWPSRRCRQDDRATTQRRRRRRGRQPGSGPANRRHVRRPGVALGSATSRVGGSQWLTSS